MWTTYPIPKLRPKDVLKTSPKNVLTSSGHYRYGPICNAKGRICSGTSLGRTQDVNLTIIHEWVFKDFFLFFLIPTVYLDIVLPKLVKNQIGSILVLLWPGTFRNRTIRGRPQDVVCILQFLYR